MSLVLVTGGAGFIGSHTVDRLINEGYDVRILDNLQKPVHIKGKPDYLNSKAEFIKGDVRNKDNLKNALKDVEYIYHFAAYQDYLTDFSNFYHCFVSICSG
jgi:dTDP-L-rhamnose 4-epimerase